MKIYEKHGFSEFVLALGYKGEFIKEYFMHYHATDERFLRCILKTGAIEFTNPTAEDWKVSV
jgi:glucose-1-phosphate cytidylyltransferase